MSDKNNKNLENNSDAEWEIDNLPNRLTILRILLIPIIILTLWTLSLDLDFSPATKIYLGYIAAFFFVIAAITDFFDGFFARKHNLITVFGSFLDPMADKFLVVATLIMLQTLGRIHPLLIIILVLREIYIMGLRLLAQERGHQIPVDHFGKWKTATQMLGIPLLLAFSAHHFPYLYMTGNIMIIIAAILSIYSASHYSYNLIKKLKAERKNKKSLKQQKSESNNANKK